MILLRRARQMIGWSRWKRVPYSVLCELCGFCCERTPRYPSCPSFQRLRASEIPSTVPSSKADLRMGIPLAGNARLLSASLEKYPSRRPAFYTATQLGLELPPVRWPWRKRQQFLEMTKMSFVQDSMEVDWVPWDRNEGRWQDQIVGLDFMFEHRTARPEL